jgi:hypothetical protein
VAIVSFGSLISVVCHAELPEGFTGTRPAGMGGAFTAVANDENAFWTNPAGVARARKARARHGIHIAKFPNVSLGVNAGSRGLYTAIMGASSSNIADSIAAADILSDKPFYIRGSVFPVIMFEAGKNQPMGFGLVSNSVSKIYIDKDIPTDARVVSITDVGAGFGIAYTNFANRLNLGVTLRPTYRYAYENTIPVEELKNKTSLARRFRKDSNAGLGVGVDVGAMFTLSDFWFPTIGIAARNLPTGCQGDYLNPNSEERQNICGTKYSGKGGNPDALSRIDPTDLRAGVSISPRFSRELGLRFAADIHNVYMKSSTAYYGLPGVDIAKLLHGGLEVFSGNPLEQSRFSLRVGSNQGFVTYGASILLPWFHVDFASYGVDISDQAKRVEDRRYLASIGSTF